MFHLFVIESTVYVYVLSTVIFIKHIRVIFISKYRTLCKTIRAVNELLLHAHSQFEHPIISKMDIQPPWQDFMRAQLQR